jgi:hypothetical protein
LFYFANLNINSAPNISLDIAKSLYQDIQNKLASQIQIKTKMNESNGNKFEGQKKKNLNFYFDCTHKSLILAKKKKRLKISLIFNSTPRTLII